jgi:tetratricopeptide (TPR) repeat protein
MCFLSKAITDFNTAIALTPRQNSEMYYSRAVAYIALKGYQNAVNDLNQAIRINPQFAQAYKQRGGGHYFLGNISQARTDFTTALNLYRQQGNQSEVNRMQRLLQLISN